MTMQSSRVYLIAALCLSGVCIGHAVPSLSDVCEDSREVQIERVSEVHQLAEQLKSDGRAAHGCSDTFERAVVKLDSIVKDELACSVSEASSITDFYNNLEDRANLPGALMNFVIAYVLKVSGLCRRAVVDSFLQDFTKVATPEDLALLKPLYEEGSPVDQLVKGSVKPGEYLLPSDINRALPGGEGLFIRGSSNDLVEKARSLCTKLRPMYEEGLGPLAIFARAGFTQYTQVTSLNSDSPLLNWNNIIFLCESLGEVEVTEAPSCNMKGSQQKQQSPAGDAYAPEIKIGDQIVDQSDSKLLNAIDRFHVRDTSTTSFEERLLDKATAILLSYLVETDDVGAITKRIESIGSCDDNPALAKVKEELLNLVKSRDPIEFTENVKLPPIQVVHLIIILPTIEPISDS